MIESSETPQQAKRPLTREERRRMDRAAMAHARRQGKDVVARNIANDRGTLPNAREIARINRARRDILARLQAAHDANAEVEAIVGDLPPEVQEEARAAIQALLPTEAEIHQGVAA